MFSLYFLALLLLQSVSGDFTVTLQLNSLSDPGNTLQNGNRCDGDKMFGKDCDIEVNLCLEDAKNPSPGWHCNAGWRKTGVVAYDTDRVTFMAPAQYGSFSNPMFYKFTGIYVGFRLKIQIYDYNFGQGPDSLIDQYVYQVTVNAGSGPQTRLIQHQRTNPPLQPTTLNTTCTVVCTSGSGDNCLGGSSPTPPPPRTTTNPSCSTQNLPATIYFVVDATANTGMTNFQAVQNYLYNYVTQFTYTSQYTQFGYSFYAANGDNTGYCLPYFHSLADVQKLIKSIRYQGGYQSWLTDALADVYACITDFHVPPKQEQIVILFSPGTVEDFSGANEFANNIRQQSYKLLSVGLGANANMTSLAMLSGGQQDTIKLSDVSQIATTVSNWLLNYLCVPTMN